jgi:RecA-family ATPase
MTQETNFAARSSSELAEQLNANGYAPLPIPRGQKGPRVSGWRSKTFTPADFPDGCNIGIRCGDNQIAAMDIDVLDESAAAELVREWTSRHPGDWMLRTGQAPKVLLPFRFTTTGQHKQTADLGALGKIEVLAEGQQFVAFGMHPDTGQPYTWAGLDPTDRLLGVAEHLPLIAPDAVSDFLIWAKQLDPQNGHQRRSGIVIASQPPQAPPSEAEVRQMLTHIPPDIDYDNWLRVLMGLHSLGDHTLPLAIEWSQRGSKYKPGEVERKWCGFERGGGLSWHSVAWMARDHGVDLSMIAARHDNSGKLYERFVVPSPERKSSFFCAAELAGTDVPERVWLVDDWIPFGNVTSLYGDGGTGKSLCAMQLAVSCAAEQPWLGRACRSGRALYISAEDDRPELHRRVDAVANSLGLNLSQLGDLHLRSLAGEDALLANLSRSRDGTLCPSSLFEEIKRYAIEIEPVLIVLDTLADLYPGDENNRMQTRQFIRMLSELAIEYSCAVLLLAHPSQSGITSDRGTAGSTAWNNSVRSRLFMKRVTRQDGHSTVEDDPDSRILAVRKSNYGRTDHQLRIFYKAGVFVVEAQGGHLDRVAHNAKAERVFLSLLDDFLAQGRTVKSVRASGYAPKAFVETGRAEGLSKSDLHAAMERLFAKGEIVEELGGSGPPSRQSKRIVRKKYS